MIYLDNSSTTPVDPDVMQTMINIMQHRFGNPASLHDLGMQAEDVMEKSREVIARELHCQRQEVLFTSGGTESNNMAIQGVAFQYRNRGKHIITTEIEHDSVYGVCQKLERQGWRVTYLPVDDLGRVNLQHVEEAITDETVLLSVIHVNNEVGTIQPIEEMGQLLKKYPRILFHVDAVQSFGRIPLFPTKSNIDLMSISAHKLHGPKGIGCLYKKMNLMLDPLVIGGDQESGFRAGTPNVPGIAGMAKATLIAKEKRSSFLQQCQRWKNKLIQHLQAKFPEMKVNGDVSSEGGAPYIINLSFPMVKSEVLVHALEEEGIYVGTRSACSSKKEEPSRILTAMGVNKETALGTIRISMGFATAENDISRTIQSLEKVIPTIKK